MTDGRIVVATSFPPKLVRTNAGRAMPDYDRLCIRSWIECGFHIVSLNRADEIPALAARYPEVDFFPTERDASGIFGRSLPFIADILCVLAAQKGSVFGIINCDLIFQPSPGWQRLKAFTDNKIVVTGQRYDLRTLDGGAIQQFYPGFDYFFFNREAAHILAAETRPFCMGLPWWDYWFPLNLALKGFKIRCLKNRAVLHIAHGTEADAHSLHWRRMAHEFSRSIAAHSRPQWPELFALCRELSAVSETEIMNGARDEHFVRLVGICVPLISGDAFELSDTHENQSSLPFNLFDDMPSRIEAGHALQQAIWEDNRGQFENAGRLYAEAVRNAPRDPGTLWSMGSFLLRRNDFEGAVTYLSQAVEREPHSAMLLNSLGSTLGQIGRDEEAIRCFERAVESEPMDGASYFNLALALHPFNRHEEVMRRLEQVRDFPEGKIWLARIREKVTKLRSTIGHSDI